MREEPGFLIITRQGRPVGAWHAWWFWEPVAASDNGGMPTYAYRCRDCAESFEVQRSMSDSNAPATCPQGHRDTVKLLTTVALAGSGAGSGPAPAPSGGGGCCGGGCCG